jgi:cytoskeletal protein CcmA (bactofilin family)
MWKPATPPTNNTPKTSRPPETEKTLDRTLEKTMTPTPTPTANTNLMNEPTPAAAPRNAALNSQEQASIGKSLVIKGEVSGSESLYIDGRVEGSIMLPGNRVTIGRNGVVAANVTAREIVVIGKLKGNLTASDRVDIRNEGSLTGDVVAQRISIEDGAFFKGGIDIRKPGHQDSKDSNRMEPAKVSEKAKEMATASA